MVHTPGGPTVSIVVPVFNEERNLCHVLPLLPADAEVVVVDGGSSDDSLGVVARLRPDAVVVQQTRWGKGNALACGFAAATGDVIVMLDADGSADPREIDSFVAALTSGADFAKGTRFAPGGGSADITVIRRIGNWGLTVLTNLLFGMHFTDLCYGYNAFWRDVLPLLELPDHEPAGGEQQWGDGFEIETVINCRAATSGLVIREVPSHERHRLHGPSNLRAVSDGSRVLRTLLVEYRARDRSPQLTPAIRHFAEDGGRDTTPGSRAV
ncbi:glycosyltransferase family 2 protein [Gordonia crocea]|uniref:glycosyltransferase family 2 protein n=1 Tax=Gordonia crocea TaxID=589162 RepID=UPI001E64D79B|nr:glycosyltransferase family 2 protein [Gordonia crocea]